MARTINIIQSGRRETVGADHVTQESLEAREFVGLASAEEWQIVRRLSRIAGDRKIGRSDLFHLRNLLFHLARRLACRRADLVLGGLSRLGLLLLVVLRSRLGLVVRGRLNALCPCLGSHLSWSRDLGRSLDASWGEPLP